MDFEKVLFEQWKELKVPIYSYSLDFEGKIILF